MKRYVLSAITGALATLLLLSTAANISTTKKQKAKGYQHIDYISHITQKECFVCGEDKNTPVFPYRGQDNVGIVDLNTLELLYLEINRYDDQGNLIKEPAGYISGSSLSNQEAETYVHAESHPDHAYAHIQITGVNYAIDREAVQNHLCQGCLDAINTLWFTDQPPAEFAVISFEEQTIQPFLNAHPWFSAGNFGIDCEFKANGAIDLLIHYCPNRFES